MSALPTREALATVPLEAFGTTNSLVVTRPEVAGEAARIALAHLADVDLAVSRFRPDSEVSRLAARAEHNAVDAFVTTTFTAYLVAALRAARLTGGLVDPTVGSALVATGYDTDIAQVRGRGTFHRTRIAGVPRWHSVHLNPSARRVEVPRGTLLDLGASAKAHAADTVAAMLADALPGGFLVNLGGDIAVAGEPPRRGWSIGIDDASGHPLQVVTSVGQAVATSSTQRRAWLGDDGPHHHIVDPRTGQTAATVWAQVSCAGASSLEANAASTAAIILGEDAPEWLATQGIPARLDAVDGRVVRTLGWPDPVAWAA
ncbi:thiamine biosynthesis lipoprotein [Humibacillus xanthopallidus]|uniref:FAD:protein FMN transferase n=1 Tax=Humibacillus xanthopallidus TaxID=412689 RepID=A0A543PKF4_9MICO|nr:FAD:protein FMN transferase [Humibacillus xanthopallidus]TQN44543.1 thiamine biosynthesis lipoprotein [Humibacillus xanthopallidus]